MCKQGPARLCEVVQWVVVTSLDLEVPTSRQQLSLNQRVRLEEGMGKGRRQNESQDLRLKPELSCQDVMLSGLQGPSSSLSTWGQT